jgi:hypothetical protein
LHSGLNEAPDERERRGRDLSPAALDRERVSAAGDRRCGAGVGIIDEGIATELKAAFQDDLKSCVEMKAESWDRDYNLWHRTFDRACCLLSGQL